MNNVFPMPAAPVLLSFTTLACRASANPSKWWTWPKVQGTDERQSNGEHLCQPVKMVELAAYVRSQHAAAYSGHTQSRACEGKRGKQACH